MFSADLIKTMQKMSTPKRAEDISERIVCYGRFLDSLNDITSFIQSDNSSFAILRGNSGVGKKSLLRAAENNYFTIDTKFKPSSGKLGTSLIKRVNLKVIYLNPFQFSDDYGAIKYIAKELGLKIRPSITELLDDITQRKGLTSKGKIVIVLMAFEEFCRQKQSLLYNLTNLTQHGENINILGLTSRINCTSELEKRVRSRINAICYELQLPYSSKQEYVEFACELLGNFKISGKLKFKLEELYMYGSRNIMELKQFLINLCEWKEDGKMIVHQPDDVVNIKILRLPTGSFDQTEETLKWLTKPTFELLKMIVCYSHLCSKEVTLNDLGDWVMKRNVRNFDTTSPLAIKNLASLMQISLVKQTNYDSMLGRLTKFTSEITGHELRHFLERNHSYCNHQSDLIWKEI